MQSFLESLFSMIMCTLYQNERNVGNPLERRRGFSEQVDGIRQTGLRVPPQNDC